MHKLLTNSEFTKLLSSLAEFAKSQGYDDAVSYHLQQALVCHQSPGQLPIALVDRRRLEALNEQ